MEGFLDEAFLPASLLAKITDVRLADPECSRRIARARKRRSTLTPDGRLNILAADHPARRVTKVGDDSLRMADRRSYLARIVRVLQSHVVDGVMATMDVVEDLLTLHHLILKPAVPACWTTDCSLLASIEVV